MLRKESLMGMVASLALGCATGLHAAVDYPYEYDFVSSDTGVSGKLFLDVQSSLQGSTADIGPSSYLSFNLYNGYIPPVTFSLNSLSTSLDPNLSFAWNSSQILTPLDIAIGLGNNDVLLSRELSNPNNKSPIAPEYDAVNYYDDFVDGGKNPLNGKTISSAAISLIATEETFGVGANNIVYNIPFDQNITGAWVAVVVPEPGQMALLAALAAAGFALLSHGKGQQSIAKMFLRTILRRVPPTRG